MQGFIYLLILLANATSLSIFQFNESANSYSSQAATESTGTRYFEYVHVFSILSITNFRLGKFRKFIMTILALS